MKKYLKNGLSILTCVAMCVQSPLAVLAEDATEVQNEMQSENPVVQPTDLQTLDPQIVAYAQEPAQWKQNTTGWWYQNADGSYPRNQWQYINGSWYHFDGNGYMQTGWQKIGRDWYYLNAGGDMRTGWLQSGNVWYYLKSSGAMATNEWVDGGVYYVDANGIYIPGKTQTTGSWQKDNTGWLYRNADGSYPTDKWEEINSKWYHFNTSGYMETGWITTGDLWYHLAESGELTCGYPNGGETVKLTKTVNATCTTDGYQEYTCSKCGETHRVMLPKTGHNYQVSKKVDATCTADGYEVYTCANCKDTYTKTTQQKLGHDFSKKLITRILPVL